jgi:group I intron endonuclease
MKNLKESITNPKEIIAGVYKIISPSGKAYIGQSMNVYKRMNIYKNGHTHSQPKIHRSFTKYGFANHIFYLLEICEIDMLMEREVYYKCKHVEEHGWEMALFCDLYDQGSGPRSEETKRKLSEGKIGKKHAKPHSNKGVPRPDFMTDETKQKISLANQKPKPPRSEEHSRKIGESHMGKSKGHKGRISPMRGKIHSTESKEKARLNNLGKNNKSVLQYSKDGIFIQEWESQTIAAQSLGKKSGAAIGQCAKGKYVVIYGYKWKYKTN